MSGPRRREKTVRDLMPSDVVVRQLWVADKKDALTELLNALVIETGVADLGREGEFRDSLFQREQVASTGIGNGMALPHVKSKHATKMAVAVGTHEDGIDWGAHDGQPATLIVLWVCQPGDTQQHLALMRALASVAKDDDQMRKLTHCRARKQFLEALSEIAVS